MTTNNIRRLIWLIETIRNAKSNGLSLSEIQDKWSNRTDRLPKEKDDISSRTFYRDIKEALNLFGVEIECHNTKYKVLNPEVLQDGSVRSWIFNSLSLESQLMSSESISDRIIFENVPKGSRWMGIIAQAIIESKRIEVTYHRYGELSKSVRKLEPYALKQSKRRWYLLAQELRDYLKRQANHLRTFALDRIEEIQILDEAYQPDKGVDVARLFDEVIGINLDDDYDCERVVLRVRGKQRHYLEGLPLHHSQKALEAKEDKPRPTPKAGAPVQTALAKERDYTDFELMVRPEYELQREILRLGADAEVLSPQWLRDEIRKLALATAQAYASH